MAVLTNILMIRYMVYGVYIPNCTNLNISGATHSLIGYFKDIIPSTNNYLGRDFKRMRYCV